LNISRADFQISGLTVGGYFTSVGYLSDLSLQANETRIFSIKWNATVGGHHCIRVVLTYSPATQALQRNIDIENAIALENGVVDIEAYVDGQLIGGVRKTIQTIRPYPDFSITGPACRIMMFLPVKLGGGPIPCTKNTKIRFVFTKET
jgi:hypothetical protein